MYTNELLSLDTGANYYCYKLFGSHIISQDTLAGVRFAVWAPNAISVSIVGDFNNWIGEKHVMSKIDSVGIWYLFIPGLKEGDMYKYQILTSNGEIILKSDPYAFYSELRPQTASKVYSLENYEWNDGDWQLKKKQNAVWQNPINIYEVHLGSWRRAGRHNYLSYRQLADQLIDYVVEMGYTHLEIMPIMEHPYDGSWGYQVTGYYSVTSRYGTPRDFMYFVDKCHQKGIGVILDWVPGHFCKDEHGLRCFDGTALYENHDSLKSENYQWGTCNFDFEKQEVRSFLISNALFWLNLFHIDGLRVDAVAQMLYLDYGKDDGQWIPNYFGGKENLNAVSFMKELNEQVFKHHPNALMIAEESTQWPMVTKPTYTGGLGYNYKWNMGWMNDILKYMESDSIHRKWLHNLLTFSFMYTFSENYVLPLSHDEVVHGKRSLISKMPGDYWQKFANLRLLYGYMIAHPGKKLLFMGGEFGQFIEWQYQESLDWHLLDYDMHQKIHRYAKEINHFYKKERILWELDHEWRGFEWIDPHDYNQSIISFMRRGEDPDNFLIVICNFTPVNRDKYRIGVPLLGNYIEVFNSDLEIYGGTGHIKNAGLIADSMAWHNQPYSLELKIPPLSVMFISPLKPYPKK